MAPQIQKKENRLAAFMAGRGFHIARQVEEVMGTLPKGLRPPKV